MKTLQYLNGIAGTVVSFTDSRPSGVIFDRPQGKSYDFTASTYSFALLVGGNILEIINPVVANVRYKINLGNALATLSYASLPPGVVVSQSGTIYTIYGIDSVSDWEAVKDPNITLDLEYQGTFSYDVTILYNTDTTADNEFTWTVGVFAPVSEITSTFALSSAPKRTASLVSNITNITILSCDFDVNSQVKGFVASPDAFATLYCRPKVDPFLSDFSDFNYTSGQTELITGVPAFEDLNTGVIYTVTITPSIIHGISTFTNSGSGGTFAVNSLTKVITIIGTPIQVNSRLQNINLVSIANQDWDFDLSYSATNNINESTVLVQRLKSINFTYLSAIQDDTFQTNVLTGIETPTLQNSIAGTYTLDVYTDNPSDIDVLQAQWSAYDWSLGTALNFSSTSNPRLETILSKDGARISVREYINYNQVNEQILTDVYTRSGNTISLERRFTLDEAGYQTSNFNSDASKIVIYNSTAAINSYIYVFSRSGTTWTQDHKITVDTTGGGFGGNISISDDGLTIAMGSRFYPATGVNTQSGRIDVWRYSSGSWTQTTILEPNYTSGAANTRERKFASNLKMSTDGRYISCHSISNPTYNTTDPNAQAYVFYRATSSWATQFTLSAANRSRFRHVSQVTDAGDRIAVVLNNSGNRYAEIYKRTSTTWSLESTIDYANNYDTIVLDTDGNTIVLTDSFNSIGNALIYKKIQTAWYLQDEFTMLPTENYTLQNEIASSNEVIIVNGVNALAYNRYLLSRSASYQLLATKANPSDFSNITKTYTFTGDFASINLALTTLEATLLATEDITLTYKLTTPTSVIIYRNQRLERL